MYVILFMYHNYLLQLKFIQVMCINNMMLSWSGQSTVSVEDDNVFVEMYLRKSKCILCYVY